MSCWLGTSSASSQSIQSFVDLCRASCRWREKFLFKGFWCIEKVMFGLSLLRSFRVLRVSSVELSSMQTTSFIAGHFLSQVKFFDKFSASFFVIRFRLILIIFKKMVD